ncbi:DoxX family protein [Costertonia aggregata]|uniref:DoxX family protein n=1 Tax=Costertonia aggregata TaxID=343403 RepID=UPI0037428C42
MWNINGNLAVTETLKYSLAVFYVAAGAYHFVNPDFYHSLIPDYLPYPVYINYLSGLLEIAIGVLVLNQKTRKMACYAIIGLLLIFILSHIYFIQIGSCADNSLCVPAWVSWGRLLVVHPLLIYWAWLVSNIPQKQTNAY